MLQQAGHQNQSRTQLPSDVIICWRFEVAECFLVNLHTYCTDLKRDTSPQSTEVLIDGIVVIIIVRYIVVIIWRITNNKTCNAKHH